MSKGALTLLSIALLASAIFLACGETDPSNAPAGAHILFVGWESDAILTLNYGGIDDYDITAACYPYFVNLMIWYCQNAMAAAYADSTPSQTDTADQYVDSYLSLCESGAWVNWANEVGCDPEDPIQACDGNTTYSDIARNQLQAPGDCGYYEVIMTAMVFKGTRSTVEATQDTGASFEPLNDIEVRWTVSEGVQIFELADDPATVNPLVNPYLDRTDDRGLSEIKVRVPLPVVPGTETDYLVYADIGVDQTTFQVKMVAEDITASSTDDTTL